MCNVLECVSQTQQIFWNIVCSQYIFIQIRKDCPIGVNSIGKLNMRNVSLNSALIDLPQDCIKKKNNLSIYFMLLQTDLWGFS